MQMYKPRPDDVTGLPKGVLEASRSAWYCPGLEAGAEGSPCRDILDAFGIRPDSNRRWGIGWGNPLAPVWFVGINPQIPVEKPERWGVEDPAEWSAEKALSNYGEGQCGYNPRHFNYHRDIMRMVAARLDWPDGLLQDRAYVTDIILCGSPEAGSSERMTEIARRCAGRHFLPLVKALKPKVLVPVGLIPYRQICRLLGAPEAEFSKPMSKVQACAIELTCEGNLMAVMPMPQPWRRWRPGEKRETMRTLAEEIVRILDEAADRAGVGLRLTMGFLEETWGAATADASDALSYSGEKADVVRRCVEGYAESTGKSGPALLRGIRRSPQSYWWTGLGELPGESD